MRVLFHFPLLLAVLLANGVLDADQPDSARATRKEQQAEVRKLLKRYSRARSDFSQRVLVVDEALALGSPFTAALRTVIGHRGASDLQSYRRLFAARFDAASRITPAGVVATSDVLTKLREELIRSAVLAARLERRVPDETFNSDGSRKNKDARDSGFAEKLQQMEEELIQQWLVTKGYGRLNSAETALVAEVNRVRAQQELEPLEVDFKLSAVARDHSLEMARRGFLSHASKHPGKKTFSDRARRFGTTAAAENIANGASAAEAMSLWLASPGHRKNILGPFQRIGIGRVGRKFTMMFGQ